MGTDVVIESGSDMGGEYKVVSPGRCVRCKCVTRVRLGVGGKGNDGERSADPRGVCGLRAACEIDPADYSDSYSGPAPVVACWNCFNERGSEGQDEVFAILVRKHGWAKFPKPPVDSKGGA